MITKKKFSPWTVLFNKIKPIDYVILSCAVFVFILFFFFFKRENRIIDIRLKLTDSDVRSMGLRALDEYSTAFNVEDREYNELGQIVSEITRVDSYRTDPKKIDTDFIQQQSQTVYLNIRAKAVYNPRKRQFSIRGKPISAGQSMVFNFANAKAEGIITDFPGFTSILDMPEKKLVVRAQLRDPSRFFSDTYGAPSFIAQAIHENDIVTDSNGVELAKVLNIEISPARRTVVSSAGSVSVVLDQELKDIYYTLELNARIYQHTYYMYDYVPIFVGQRIPLSFATINILPTIIDIHELDETK